MTGSSREHLLEGERAGMRYALAVPREALRGASGYWSGRLSGSSVDFKDYREYQPGDDLRAIDWSVYGRTDRLIVKLFREEVNPHLDIVIDCSASMALEGTEKCRATVMLGAALAMASMNARCSHHAWMIADAVRSVQGGTGRPALWAGLEFDHTVTPAEAFNRLPGSWRPQGIRVLVSDLLWPGDPIHTLRSLASGAAALFVIQVLAREDATPSVAGNAQIVDVETHAAVEVFMDALAAQSYAAALARHQTNWERACRQAGARMTTVIAEEVVATGRFDALERMSLLEPA